MIISENAAYRHHARRSVKRMGFPCIEMTDRQEALTKQKSPEQALNDAAAKWVDLAK